MGTNNQGQHGNGTTTDHKDATFGHILPPWFPNSLGRNDAIGQQVLSELNLPCPISTVQGKDHTLTIGSTGCSELYILVDLCLQRTLTLKIRRKHG